MVDTLGSHYEAYRVVFESLGINLLPEEFYSNLGGKATEAIPLFLGGRQSPISIQEIHTQKKEIIADLFTNGTTRILPTAGFLPLFHGRVPLALVSSGAREGIELLLKRLGWTKYFDVIVTGEDTPKSKPDPMPYLLAAEKLGIAPNHIAAFEDTTAGLESARRAGMTVYDVGSNIGTSAPA